MSLNRKIKDLYGKPETVIPAFSITTLVIYCIFIYIFNDNLTIQSISKYYNTDVANVSGVLSGFVFASFGLLLGLKNNVIDKLNTTKNIKVVHKILLATVFFFVVSIIIYFLKDLIIFNYDSIVNFSLLRYSVIKYILLFGLYCFSNAFVLFLLSLYILKKILIN